MTFAIMGYILLGVVIGFVGGWVIGYVLYNPKFENND